MHTIRFTCHPPGNDRKHFIDEHDVRTVLARLPDDLWRRLRAVHFNDLSQGARVLGYVTGNRREIAICALPPRVSLTRFCVPFRMSPTTFGAVHGAQWPEVAVRRFLLYDTFLHELGHLQVVDETSRSERLRFARSTRAHEFARHWRKKLWAAPFDDPDPAHNPPCEAELESMRESLLRRTGNG